jgi:hypothetical protein
MTLTRVPSADTVAERPLKTHGPTGEAMSSRNAQLGIVVGVDDSPAAKVAVDWRRAMQSYVMSR